MVRVSLLVITLTTLLVPASQLTAQSYRSLSTGIISSAEAARYGLVRPWYTQVEVDRTRGGVVHIFHHINSKRAETLYEVVYDRGIKTFSEFGIDRYGDVRGDFGATEAAAKFMREILLEKKQRDPKGDHKVTDAVLGPVLATIKKIDDIKDSQRTATSLQRIDVNSLNIGQDLLTFAKESPDVTPRLQKTVQPEITMYALTDRGAVQAINAETGETRWLVSVGNPRLPSAGLSANDDRVSVVNGSKIYLLDSKDGRLLWSHRIEGTPGAPPAAADTHIFVPLSGGTLVGYEIGERLRAPIRHVSHGRSMIEPLLVGGSIVWPTDRGHTYVANSDRGGVRYRLETETNVVSQPCYLRSDNMIRLFVTSLDGYCYCINEKGSGVLWRFSTGIPISHQPVAFKDSVYIITDENTMYSIDVATGKERWWISGIRDFVSASENRLYVRNFLGDLVILDTRSGSRLGQMSARGVDWHYVNTQTDRIFMGTRTGKLQCLHERDLRYPLIHDGDFQVGVKKPKADGEEGGDGDDPKGGGGNDPNDIFGGGGAGNDIFGGGNKGGNNGGNNGGAANPFDGGGANPFE